MREALCHLFLEVLLQRKTIGPGRDSVSNPDHEPPLDQDQEFPGSEVSFLLNQICSSQESGVEQGRVQPESEAYDNGLLDNSSGSRHGNLCTLQNTQDRAGSQYEFLNGCVAGFPAESGRNSSVLHSTIQPSTTMHSTSLTSVFFPLFDGIIPGSLETMDQTTPYGYPEMSFGDFTLFAEDEDMDQFGQFSEQPPAAGPHNTDSPLWTHEDALGTPVASSPASAHLEDQGRGEDLNALARRRLQENDEGKRRRKLSASNPVNGSRVQKKSSQAQKKGSQVQKRAAPERKIRRPRKPSLFCHWEGCGASFTRQREFEMHMGKHEKPLFYCEVCSQLLTRKDNRRKHDDSQRHKDNVAASKANLANSPVPSSDSSSSPSSLSSPSSSSSGPIFSSNPSPVVSASTSSSYTDSLPLFLLDQIPQYLDVGGQTNISSNFEEKISTEEKMSILQAKMAVISSLVYETNFEMKELMQEMGTTEKIKLVLPNVLTSFTKSSENKSKKVEEREKEKETELMTCMSAYLPMRVSSVLQEFFNLANEGRNVIGMCVQERLSVDKPMGGI
ncbi:hypothetical protein TWF481_010783 [Arthrobotrys musiformis]|uniref:Matrin-type domain-containing protein n=1 Tax=Arthrobotrys musiformis TaxID=47236 RepID=A0AAV9W4I9_9PEZI